ncbi:MAG TPA: aldo/keto reductase, partial [Bacteroidetes bacterium]|nr:aldo/keto reductase [Bacteroidota bacterium]
ESPRLSDKNLAIAREVAAIAAELGTTSPRVALAWIRAKVPTSIPIIGARSVDQLRDNLGATSITLSAEHLTRLDSVSAIERGFPHDFLASENIQRLMGLTDF